MPRHFRYFLAILLLLSVNMVVGIPQDQILKAEELLESTEGNDRLPLLKELSRLYLEVNPEKSINYSKEIVSLTAKNPSENATSLYNLGNIYRKVNNYRLALDCQNQALEIRKSLNDLPGISSSLNNLGEIHKILNKYDEAIAYFNQSLAIRKENGTPREIAYTLNNIGSIYWLRRNYAQALDYYLKSLEIRLQTGDKSDISSSLNNLGNVYKSLNKYNKALDYYTKALKIREELEDKDLIAYSLNDIGGIYWHLNNYNESLDFYFRSLKLRKELGNKQNIASTLKNIGTVYKDLNELDFSLKHYNEALKIYEKINDTKEQANVFSNIGNLYRSFNNFDKGLEYHKIGLDLHRKLGHNRGIAYSSNSIGEILMDFKKSDEAILFFTEALENAQKAKDRTLQKMAAENLFEFYSNNGDYKKALEYYREYTSNQYDSIVDQQGKDKISELEASYEISKNKDEIKNLKEYNHLQTLLIYLFIALILLAGIVGYVTFKNIKIRKEATIALTEKNNELEEINSRLKESEIVLRDINLSKDKIFSIISKDLREPFDDLKEISNKLLQSFAVPNITSQKELSQEIQYLSTHTSELVETLLLWASSQSGKTKFTPKIFNIKELLDNTLQKLAEPLVEKKLKVIFNMDHTSMAYADTSAISEVFKNLLSNAIKYSFPNGKITLTAKEKKYLIEMEISDEGIGMSQSNLNKIFRLDSDYLAIGTAQEKGAGIGLLLCKEYVEKNGGKIWADSEEGKGSSFYFTIPKSDKLMGTTADLTNS